MLKIKKLTGAMLLAAALLLAFTGCNNQVDPPIQGDPITAVTISVDQPHLVNDGVIFLAVDEQITLTANVTGGGLGTTFEWSTSGAVPGAVNFSSTNSQEVTITAAQEGSVTITVTATFFLSSESASINAEIRPAGAPTWNFSINEGTTVIGHGGTLRIPAGAERTITLETAEPGVTFDWESGNSGIAALSDISATSFRITAGNAIGSSTTITVTAKKGEDDILTRTFTVEILYVQPEIGVIFEWCYTVDPIPAGGFTTGNTGTALAPTNFPFLFMRARDPVERSPEGAIRLGGTVAPTGRLIIGGWNHMEANSDATPNPAGANTTADVHIPGQFDLSEGLFRLTLNFRNHVAISGLYPLRISVNNNTTGRLASVLGGESDVRTYINGITSGTFGNLLTEGRTDTRVIENEAGTVTLIFDPKVWWANATEAGKASLRDAFIKLHAQPGAGVDNGITITRIKLEQLGPQNPPTAVRVTHNAAPVEANELLQIRLTNTAGLVFTADYDVPAEGTPVTVSWEIAAGGEDFVEFENNNATGTSVTILPKAPGTATINVTASNTSLNTVTTSLRVEVLSSPPTAVTIKTGDETIARGSTRNMDLAQITGILFDADVAVPAEGIPVTINWEIAAGGESFVEFESGNDTGASVTILPKAVGTARINVTVTNAYNMGNPLTTYFNIGVIQVIAKPTNLIVKTGGVEVDENQLFPINRSGTITFTAEATDSTSYHWSIIAGGEGFVSLSATSGTTVTITGIGAGTATINVIARNSAGDSDPTSFQVQVNPVGVSRLGIRGHNASVVAHRLAAADAQVTNRATLFIPMNDTAGLALIAEVTAVAGDDIDITWTIDSGQGFVGFLNNIFEGETVTFIPSAPGTAAITVTACNGEGTPVTVTFNVRVVATTTMFAWNNTDGFAQTLTFPVRMNAGNTGLALSPRDYPNIFFRNRGQDLFITQDGITLGRRPEPVTGTAGRLIIGGGNNTGANTVTNPNPAAADTSQTLHIPGQFNLTHSAEGSPTGWFRLTIDYRDAVMGAAWLFRVHINNNGGGAASTVLHPGVNFVTRGDYTLATIQTGLNDAFGQVATTTVAVTDWAIPSTANSGRLILNFNPAIRHNNHASLEDAFIMIFSPNENELTITGITLERVTQ